jgi:hypothetical protein
LHQSDNSTDADSTRTNDCAVINIGQEDHISLEVETGIYLGWGKTSINKALLEFLKPIETGLFEAIETPLQFEDICARVVWVGINNNSHWKFHPKILIIGLREREDEIDRLGFQAMNVT